MSLRVTLKNCSFTRAQSVQWLLTATLIDAWYVIYEIERLWSWQSEQISRWRGRWFVCVWEKSEIYVWSDFLVLFLVNAVEWLIRVVNNCSTVFSCLAPNLDIWFSFKWPLVVNIGCSTHCHVKYWSEISYALFLFILISITLWEL